MNWTSTWFRRRHSSSQPTATTDMKFTESYRHFTMKSISGPVRYACMTKCINDLMKHANLRLSTEKPSKSCQPNPTSNFNDFVRQPKSISEKNWKLIKSTIKICLRRIMTYVHQQWNNNICGHREFESNFLSSIALARDSCVVCCDGLASSTSPCNSCHSCTQNRWVYACGASFN